MDGAFRLVQKNNPKKYVETRGESFLLGRSPECDIVIPEPHISRVQAKVSFENGRHFIKNLGRNAIRINGRPTAGDFLKPGDVVTLGKIPYLYQAAVPPEERSDSEAKTQLAAEPAAAKAGQRLVCTGPSGETTSYPLDRKRLVIGRSQEADIVLDDLSVSRRHCVIEIRDGAYHARNISAANPMAVNDHVLTEKRLYSGDQLKIGVFVFALLSDRPKDRQEHLQPRRSRPAAVWLIALLCSTAAAYTAYRLAFIPWQIDRTLATASQRIEAGEAHQARETLLELMQNDPVAAEDPRAKRLLGEATLSVARERGRRAGLEAAIDFLRNHLVHCGRDSTAAPIWDQLHRCRLDMGQQLEAAQDPQQAMRQYGAIPEDSHFFPEAQKAIHRLWLDYQQKHQQQQTVAQLLREAEIHFGVKRYLTPVHQNAYSVYQAVLALDPQNETALKRIEHIRSYYRSEGEAHYKTGSWPKALAHFERYALIDPDALDIREKITACHRRLAEPTPLSLPLPSEDRTPKPAEAEGQEKIRQLLMESGAEGSWIMQYLFQEKPGEKDSETPW